MTVLFSRNLIRALVTSTALFCLSACGGGTKDFEGHDERTFVGNVNVEKKLSEKSSIDIGYLATAGSNSQFIGTGIQFDGNRITEGRVENDYAFHTITAHYNYTFLTVKRLRLTASPALQFGYVDLEGSVAGLNASINKILPAIGLKLGTSLNFSDRTSAVAEAAVYEQTADNFYFTSGIWVKHVFRNNVGLKFGYSSHYTGNGETGASDGCNSSNAQAENCNDSGFDIQSNGLHLGLEFKR